MKAGIIVRNVSFFFKLQFHGLEPCGQLFCWGCLEDGRFVASDRVKNALLLHLKCIPAAGRKEGSERAASYQKIWDPRVFKELHFQSGSHTAGLDYKWCLVYTMGPAPTDRESVLNIEKFLGAKVYKSARVVSVFYFSGRPQTNCLFLHQ